MICYDFSLINALMLVGSFAITLFSVLSAKEQADRLKNSGFGTLASGIVSILITMFEKNNENGADIYLIAYSFTGCALGALSAWLIIYHIVKEAVKPEKQKDKNKKNKATLVEVELLYTGLSGVKAEITKRERQDILNFLKEWNFDFDKTISKEMAITDSDCFKVIYTWLKLNCDLYRIALKTFGNNLDYSPEDYQSRASLIVFGQREDNYIEGYHWISYEGERHEFKKCTAFKQDSDAYKVISQEYPSIFKYDPNKTSTPRAGGDYKTYLLIRINNFCVLTIDWQSKIKEDDDIFDILKCLFQKSICPKIAEMIKDKQVEILNSKGLSSF